MSSPTISTEKKHLKCRLVGQQMNLSMLYSKQNLTLNLRYLFSSLDGKSGGGGNEEDGSFERFACTLN